MQNVRHQNNVIEQLGLMNNAALADLECNANALTNLDISKQSNTEGGFHYGHGLWQRGQCGLYASTALADAGKLELSLRYHKLRVLCGLV